MGEVEDAIIEAPPLRQSALDRIRAAARADELDNQKAKLDSPPETRYINPVDAVTLQAIRTLSLYFEVDGPGLDPYRNELSKPASVNERATAWREKRRLA